MIVQSNYASLLIVVPFCIPDLRTNYVRAGAALGAPVMHSGPRRNAHNFHRGLLNLRDWQLIPGATRALSMLAQLHCIARVVCAASRHHASVLLHTSSAEHTLGNQCVGRRAAVCA